MTPVDVVRTIYDHVAAGDLDAVAARLSPDFVAMQNDALPFGGHWHGADGFSAMGRAILAAFPGFAVSPGRMFQSADAVLVETRVSAPPADGRAALDQAMIEYWRIVDGRAAECRPFYADPSAAAASAAICGGPAACSI